MSDRKLRSALIRLAHDKPEIRGEILPLLREGGERGASVEDTLLDSMRKINLAINDVYIHMERSVTPRSREHGALSVVGEHLTKAYNEMSKASKVLSRHDMSL